MHKNHVECHWPRVRDAIDQSVDGRQVSINPEAHPYFSVQFVLLLLNRLQLKFIL